MKKFLTNLIGFRYLSITGEKIPYFTDAAHTSNKSWKLVGLRDKTLPFYELETQEGKPVLVKKNFENKGKGWLGDKNFQKNGFRVGQLISFVKQGFLGNGLSVRKVILVTDKYVYFYRKGGAWVTTLSYEELERMQKLGMIGGVIEP